MNNIIRILSSFVTTIILCTACAAMRPMDGPGMIVTFSGAIPGKSIDLRNATTSTHQPFPNPGEFGPNANPMTGGATMGAAPDGRDLPEWVEFQWKEWPYPYPPEPSDPAALQAWRDGVHAMSRSLPIKTARVAIRSRIPLDVVDEVLTSNRQTPAGKLPDKDIWIYFIWYESGVKLRWKLKSACCGLLREGGDDLRK